MKKTTDEIRSILRRVHYRGWKFFVIEDGYRPYLQLEWSDVDADTGSLSTMTSRKWLLSPHMTNSEIVQTAFKAVVTAEEHEVREHFRYREKPIFGPHFDVDQLVELMPRKDARD